MGMSPEFIIVYGLEEKESPDNAPETDDFIDEIKLSNNLKGLEFVCGGIGYGSDFYGLVIHEADKYKVNEFNLLEITNKALKAKEIFDTNPDLVKRLQQQTGNNNKPGLLQMLDFS